MATLREIRTVFMGTPEVAVTVLERLVERSQSGFASASPRFHLVGVVTQPEKPAGRGLGSRQSAVGSRATQLGIPVFTPKGLKKEENRKFLWELNPDLLVVAAYGKILPKEVLELPKYGAVNVHFSLLPRWRGPAPVPAAILAGDAETGVTIMKLDEGMDTGPILAQERLPIGAEDTTASLLPRLAEIGARLLIPTLDKYLAGALSPTPQDNTRATVCPMLKKEDGKIDWTNPATDIARMVRAYDPWPRAHTTWDGKVLIVRRARSTSDPTSPKLRRAGDGLTSNIGSSESPPTFLDGARANLEGLTPGTVVRATTPPTFQDEVRSNLKGWSSVGVTTGHGLLVLDEVQLEGRKALPIGDFVNGFPGVVGSRLGST